MDAETPLPPPPARGTAPVRPRGVPWILWLVIAWLAIGWIVLGREEEPDAADPGAPTVVSMQTDWFTLRGSGEGLPLAAETLAHFGLPVTEPDHATEQENLWRDLAGFKEVRMVGDEYGVSYVRIKALTP